MTPPYHPDHKTHQVEDSRRETQQTKKEHHVQEHRLRPIQELLVVANDEQSKYEQRREKEQNIRAAGYAKRPEHDRPMMVPGKGSPHSREHITINLAIKRVRT
jgi:hypothetical protein